MSATANNANPLVDSRGDTTAIRCALSFVSFALMEMDTGEGINLSSADSLGLAFILDTCKVALENMSEVRHD